MISVICMILLPLATARLTKLVVDDSITLPIRQKIMTKFGDSWLTTLVHCPWCSGWWIAGILSIPTGFLLSFPIWVTVLVWMAVAMVAPMVMTLADRMESGGE